MVKNRILSNSFREIKKSFRRFISLTIMSFLGVGVFVGLQSTAPDMLKTIDKYYDKLNAYDLKISSTLGWSDEDVSLFNKYNFIENINTEKEIDCLINLNSSDLVLRIHELSSSINEVKVIEGEYPKFKNEILVDKYFISQEDVEIGEEIIINSSSLKDNKYKIVGTCESPFYIDPNSLKDRGASSLGIGKSNYFVYALSESFDIDYSKYIYVTIKGAKNEQTASKKYKEIIDDAKNKIKLDNLILENSRYEEIVLEKEEELNKMLPSSLKNKEDLRNQISILEQMLQNPSLDKNSSEYLTLKGTFEQLCLLDEGYKKIEQVEKPTVQILTRNDDSDYSGFVEDADSITNLSKIFPLVFYVIAVFISLVSMSRMVEEDRLQIGTLKSMGFSSYHILTKYMLFSFIATISGGLLGAISFYLGLPLMIWNIYKIIFDIPGFVYNFSIWSFVVGLFISLICICGITFITTLKNLRINTASLLRPKAPKNGKRVFLERIPFLWKRMSFSKKITIRNIFRYKSRVIMTLIGVCGCTALLLAGFGLRDSVSSIPLKQYKEIFVYDEMVLFDSSKQEEINILLKDVDAFCYTKVSYSQNFTSQLEEKKININLISGNIDQDFNKIFNLKNLETKKKIEIKDNEAIISDKMAQLLKLKVGDSLYLKDEEYKEYELIVGEIFENYISNYVFINKQTYENVIGEYNENVAFIQNKEGVDASKLSEELLKEAAIYSIVNIDKLITDVDNMLKSLNSVVIILIILSATLSFVVMYNLSNINIAERKREIATLKVLGFKDVEVDNYIIKENLILTIIGMIFGVVLGIFLNNIICATVEIEKVRFLYTIKPTSYVFSILLSIGFTLLVNFITHFILKKIDMIESLKSVE